MKKIFFATLLFSQLSFAQILPPDEPQTQLDARGVDAVKAILAVPDAASQFNARTELMSVTIVEEAADTKIYTFSGKRRGIGNDGYRELQVVEKRSMNPDLSVGYTATLIP